MESDGQIRQPLPAEDSAILRSNQRKTQSNMYLAANSQDLLALLPLISLRTQLLLSEDDGGALQIHAYCVHDCVFFDS